MKMRFQFKDPDDYARLRELLQTAGFMDRKVLETIGVDDLSVIDGNDHPLLLERTAGDAPLHALIRLFLMEAPVGADILQNAIRPMPLEAWRHAGLITESGGAATATIKLIPFKDLVVAFDRPGLLETPLRHQYVMGIGGSTITLANLTIRHPVRRTLDLGTGCGIHALLAAAHSGRVTATDINPRAVALARFNARLNSAANLSCLEGDLFDPVGDECFDLIVTNPPFVISPEQRFIYRDGGMDADGFLRRIVREAPRHLAPGGFCQVLCNWVQEAGRDWRARLSEWFAGAGCDVWGMRSESLAAPEYAAKWIRHTEFHDSDARFAERFRKWTEYYERNDIASIGSGLVTMRKTASGDGWFRAVDGPEKMQGPAGEDVARGFALADFLEEAASDESLLEARLKYAPDLRLEQQYAPSSDGWQTTASVIQLTRGLTYRGNADALVANLIVRCDGMTPLRTLMQEMAGASGMTVDAIVPNLCPIIRKLIEHGFLLPA